MKKTGWLLLPLLPLLILSLAGCGPGIALGETLYYDGFEDAPSAWTASGLWHLQENDDSIYNTASPLYLAAGDTSEGYIPFAYGGSNCYWYGRVDTGNYDTSARTTGELISSAIDLTLAAHPMLAFRSWFEVERYCGYEDEEGFYEQMTVEIFTNGVDYSLLAYVNPKNGYTAEEENSQPWTSGGFNKPGVWRRVILDLGDYAGQTVTLKFKFDTLDDEVNYFRGWFIDDVTLAEKA